MTIRFDEALRELISWLNKNSRVLPRRRIVIVRDLRGQTRLIIENISSLESFDEEQKIIRKSEHGAKENAKHFLSEEHELEIEKLLGPYKAIGPFFIPLSIAEGFDSFYGAPDAYHHNDLRENIVVLDRLISGREWLYPTDGPNIHPTRFVFYGLKGGVGRSTALSMVAWHLARQGKKVLVIDLDLESPGLGNMLLPVRKDLSEDGDTALPGWPDNGLTDWFVEDAVGQSDAELIRSMIQPSPIQVGGRGEIIVVPAAGGIYDQDYVSKLSRVFVDLPTKTGSTEVFGDRLVRAIEQLEDHIQPDVVLLDSRAGIHHISATALTRLGAFAYLFASDSEQTWAGYSALFSHWALKPITIRKIRHLLRLVSALTPTTENKDEYRDDFGEHAFDTFVTLYDMEKIENDEEDLFSYGVFEEEAPHRPIFIWHDRVYGNFSPLRQTLQLDTEKATQVFEELFARIDRDLNEGAQN